MSDPNLSDNTIWGAAALAVTAVLGGIAKAKGYFRSEKVADAAADVAVANSTATETTIATLTKWVRELSDEIHKLRSEIRALIHQNNDCEQKNFLLTNQVKDLTRRVGAVEKDSK